MIPLDGIAAMREFLLRTTLKGNEVDAFNRCVGFLHNEERITREYLANEEIAMKARQKAAYEAEQAAAAAANQPAEAPQE